MIKWARENQYLFPDRILETVISNLKIDAMIYFIEVELLPYDMNLVQTIICCSYKRRGQLDVAVKMINWIVKNTTIILSEVDMEQAVQLNLLELVRALHELGCPWDYRHYYHALYYNQDTSIVEYLHENGCSWDDSESQTQRPSGNLAVRKISEISG